LLAERGKGINAEGSYQWDQTLVKIASIFWFISWFISAFDHRFLLSSQICVFGHVVGAIGTAMGLSIFLWAMVSNAFFTESVRIQTEKDHQVCKKGPYQIIRHPGYAGNILAVMSIPLLLGSYWAISPAAICAVIFIMRTSKEDHVLMDELAGYKTYAQIIKYRLIPRIW